MILTCWRSLVLHYIYGPETQLPVTYKGFTLDSNMEAPNKGVHFSTKMF